MKIDQLNVTTPIKRIAQPTYFSSPTLLKSNEITVGITQNEYINRRNNVFNKMKNNSLFILPSAPVKYVSPDIVHKFRQNSNFLYITGFIEPNACCVLYKKDKDNTYYYLFVTEYNKETITWDGHIAGTQMVKQLFNVNNAYNIKDININLKELIKLVENIYFDTPNNFKENEIHFIDINLSNLIYKIIQENEFPEIKILKKCQKMIEKLRLIKSKQEILLMKESGKCAANAMIEVIKNTKIETLEDRLAAIFEFNCRIRGALRMSAPVTISNGKENNILHYLNNDRTIKNGNLCLLDSGSELYNYCSDITRIFPANGIFTKNQLDIYNIVLNVQKKLIKLCIIGNTIKKLDEMSQKYLIDGLNEIGIITNNNNSNKWHSGGVHYVSHFIGMDIHDTPLISHTTKFQQNMCIAIEPGIYLPDDINIPIQYRNIGIRIEDTILITENEPQILTKDCPKNPQKIMDLMKNNNDNNNIFKNARKGIWDSDSNSQLKKNLFTQMQLC